MTRSQLAYLALNFVDHLPNITRDALRVGIGLSTGYGVIHQHLEANKDMPDIHSSSEEYAARFKGSVGSWLLETQAEVVSSLISERSFQSVADIGGGHGQLTKTLLNHGLEVTAHGSHPSCQRMLAPLIESGNINFKVGPLLELPFADQAVDLAVSIRQLNHLSSWKTLVRELCRISKSAVLLDYPVPTGLNALSARLFFLKKALEGNTRTFSLFSDQEIEQEFKANGFKLVRREGQFILPMVLHRTLKCVKLSKFVENLLARTPLKKFSSPRIALFERI